MQTGINTLLNIRKGEYYVKKRKPSIITDSNQVYFIEMIGRRVKEGVFIFLNPADQKNHIEAFTYNLVTATTFGDRRLRVERDGND